MNLRKQIIHGLFGIAFLAMPAHAATSLPITDTGAVGDGTTVNTESIQKAIDQLATGGGGTVVVPKGEFISGALFFKPGVNLHLDKDAVLKCSTDMKNFPEQRTRIEGHFEDHFNPALINAKQCDGFQLTGEGTLDGAGKPIWDQFWKERRASTNPATFRNVGVPRARLALIEDSKNVVVDGVTFKDSQFWNLHLYLCRDTTVRNARFEVPDDYKQAPSTDGIDVDSCQNITISGCYFSVTDDCIALKGSKGPKALDEKDSPPVEHIRIDNCTFKRGGGLLTLGSEATIVRDVVAEHCKMIGPVKVATIKLRKDTPQDYEDIHIRDVTLDAAGGVILSVAPWGQYTDLKGEPPPKSTVKNITLSDIKGHFGSMGSIGGNAGQTTISDITLENFDVQLKTEGFKTSDVTNLKLENVSVNGKPFDGRAAP